MKVLKEKINNTIMKVKKQSDGSEYFKGVIDGLELVRDKLCVEEQVKKDRLSTIKECFDGQSKHDESNKEFVADIFQSGRSKVRDIRDVM